MVKKVVPPEDIIQLLFSGVESTPVNEVTTISASRLFGFVGVAQAGANLKVTDPVSGLTLFDFPNLSTGVVSVPFAWPVVCPNNIIQISCTNVTVNLLFCREV